MPEKTKSPINTILIKRTCKNLCIPVPKCWAVCEGAANSTKKEKVEAVRYMVASRLKECCYDFE